MRYTLTPSTSLASAALPVTLAEAKAWLRVDGDADDGLIMTLLRAVVERVEEETGLALASRTWTYRAEVEPYAWAPYWRGQGLGYSLVLRLPRRPVTAITSVKTYDDEGAETTLALTDDYTLDRAKNVALVDTLATGEAVEVVFTAAPGVVPEALKVAVLEGLADAYDNRTTVVVGQTASVLPGRVLSMLLPFRQLSV